MAGLPLSLLNRHLRFGQLAMIDIANALFGFLAAATRRLLWPRLLVAAARLGRLGRRLAGQSPGDWSRWTPGRPDFRIDRDIMSFGANLTGFNLANFFARNLDNILIGKYSGAIELGYYDRAYKLLLFPIQNIIAPLSRVMIPLLSRVQDDKPRFRELYLQTAWLLAFVTVPGVAALICTSEQVVNILFGAKWQAITPIFAVAGPRRRGSIRQQFDGMGVHLPGQDQNHVPLGRVRLRHHHRRVHRRAAMGRRRASPPPTPSRAMCSGSRCWPCSCTGPARSRPMTSCPRNSCSSLVRRHVGDLRILPEILCGVERPAHRSDGDGAQLCACRPAGAGIP